MNFITGIAAEQPYLFRLKAWLQFARYILLQSADWHADQAAKANAGYLTGIDHVVCGRTPNVEALCYLVNVEKIREDGRVICLGEV